ncbi:tRNA-intron endonuclease catalytic domain-like protein [Coprinellus micaceus]|uniref:tRNA-intron lyase n=1 Tax=Coprinellus micaceus TaxID=71717 RepID=A0A4Y7TRP1_COPMI|nr:tRNA-intron endonuclease catalytic domain-like protein [Coprinellus micaceus]
MTIEAARQAGIWDYPANLQERARCGVFRGLWDQGYYMGVGIRFGGEYLVYPGDPLRYHSHFVATVLESPTTMLRPMEIVAHGRLGTATKKSHLLCGWDDEKKDVSYLSVEWAGFG